MLDLSVVLPVYNEEENLPLLWPELCGVLETMGVSFEVIFVDDGSRDRSAELIRGMRDADRRVRLVRLKANAGETAATDAGFKVVYGVRTNRQSDSLPKRLTADLYYRAHNYLSSDKIPEHAGDFRLLDRSVVEIIKAMPERNRFMKGLFAWSGFRQAAVEYARAERAVGKTKFRYWRLWTLALDGITSASTMPLRIWSYVGVVIAFLTLLYALWVVAKTLIFGADVAGYPSLMVAILFFGGLQLISLGVLGEYVGRILIETKRRPLYVVRKKVGLGDEGEGS